MFKKQFFLVLIFSLVMTSSVFAETVIGIIQFAGGDLYNNAKKAFKVHISKKITDVKFYEYNCNKKLDESTDKLIGDMLSKKPKLIFSLGSGITEYIYGKQGGKDIKVKHKITDIPVVYSIITHPINSGVAESFKKSGTNYTGSCVWISPFSLFKMLKKAGKFKNILVPVGKLKFGSTKTTIDLCEKNKKRLKMNFIYLEASTPEEAKAKLPEYLDKIDAIAVMFDNTAITSLVKGYFEEAQLKHKKPIVTVLPFLLPKTVFSFGTDFTKNGLYSAKKALLILTKNKKPTDIPIFVEKRPLLGINLKKAKKMKLKIPMGMISSAKKNNKIKLYKNINNTV